jgi:hypothetical protein
MFPNDPLHENLVLVECDQLAEHARRLAAARPVKQTQTLGRYKRPMVSVAYSSF